MRKLFALMVAIAVLLAPAFTGVSMAQAAVPDQHVQMAGSGHCDPARDDRQQDKTHDMACCGAMCMAVAVTPAVMPIGTPLHGSLPAGSLHAFGTGTPAELATPPPRAA